MFSRHFKINKTNTTKHQKRITETLHLRKTYKFSETLLLKTNFEIILINNRHLLQQYLMYRIFYKEFFFQYIKLFSFSLKHLPDLSSSPPSSSPPSSVPTMEWTLEFLILISSISSGICTNTHKD